MKLAIGYPDRAAGLDILEASSRVATDARPIGEAGGGLLSPQRLMTMQETV